MARRVCCRLTPASSSRLMIFKWTTSLNEYKRWLPDPLASRMDGVTRPVRAQ